MIASLAFYCFGLVIFFLGLRKILAKFQELCRLLRVQEAWGLNGLACNDMGEEPLDRLWKSEPFASLDPF